ncbi:type VII secretion target [Mycobacterium sp. NPDC050441]|uniref:type VII secretion target n=1 Tax=Mycobacterium sp. NPDC050441 TaxID=3155403 RepID=UPI0033FAEE89
MAPTLRVYPTVLRHVSADEKSVAAAASNTGAAAALADAATGMAGLHSADGCRLAQTMLDAANQAVSAALNDHSEKLEAAAQRYEATDVAFGRRFQQLSR